MSDGKLNSFQKQKIEIQYLNPMKLRENTSFLLGVHVKVQVAKIIISSIEK